MMDNNKSKLYFESHVTIEPVFDEKLEVVSALAKKHGFRVANLLMKKRSEATEERSDKDTFMTTSSKYFDDISTRTRDLVWQLQKEGFKVWRYKIEDTVLDSKISDVYGLIK